MSASVAFIAGGQIHRQWKAARIAGEALGPQATPFGNSGSVFRVAQAECPYYLLSRYGPDQTRTSPAKINSRANIYALKDLGVEMILAWGPGGAITHNIAVGELVILNDFIDQTTRRTGTFFADSPLGFLRQFPVFCPSLRRICGEVLHEMKIVYHGAGTAAVREGPQLETPAEVRMLNTIGAQIVTHAFVPEVFLARELELCYAAVCYIANYAETGSRHRPFVPGGLFGGLTAQSDGDRLAGTVDAMGRIAANVAAAAQSAERTCECDKTMQAHKTKYALSDDWRTWWA